MIVSKAEVKKICEAAKEALAAEANVVAVKAPVTVVGDIHGQFADLVEMFAIGGAAPGTDSGGGGRATGKGGGVYPAGATAESCAPVHVVPSFSQNADVPTELRAATRT